MMLSHEKQWKSVIALDVMTDSGRICPVGVIPPAVIYQLLVICKTSAQQRTEGFVETTLQLANLTLFPHR